MKHGLTLDQSHRLLESLQSLTIGAKHMGELISLCNLDDAHRKALESGSYWMRNTIERLGQDIMGMMNGNKNANNNR